MANFFDQFDLEPTGNFFDEFDEEPQALAETPPAASPAPVPRPSEPVQPVQGFNALAAPEMPDALPSPDQTPERRPLQAVRPEAAATTPAPDSQSARKRTVERIAQIETYLNDPNLSDSLRTFYQGRLEGLRASDPDSAGMNEVEQMYRDTAVPARVGEPEPEQPVAEEPSGPINTGETTQYERPIYENGDDRYSEKTITFQVGDKWYNAPTVGPNGEILDGATVQRAYESGAPLKDPLTGAPLEGFASERDASAAAAARSDGMRGTSAPEWEGREPFDIDRQRAAFEAPEPKRLAPESPKLAFVEDTGKPRGEDQFARFMRGLTQIGATLPETLSQIQAGGERSIAKDATGYVSRATEQIQMIRDRMIENPNMSSEERTRLLDVLRQSQATIDNYGPISLGSEAWSQIKPSYERDLYQMGDVLREASLETFGKPNPIYDRNFWSTISEGGGSAVGFMGITLAGALINPAVGIVAGGSAGAQLNSAMMYREAIEAGADEETALATGRIGALIGSSEVFPLVDLFKFIPRKARSEVSSAIVRRLIEAGRQGGEELIQEGGVSILNALTAKYKYDPEKRVWEGVAEEAAAGGVIGAIMGAAIGGGRRQTPDDKTPPDQRSLRTEGPPLDFPGQDMLTEADKASPLEDSDIGPGLPLARGPVGPNLGIDPLPGGAANVATPSAETPVQTEGQRPTKPVTPDQPSATPDIEEGPAPLQATQLAEGQRLEARLTGGDPITVTVESTHPEGPVVIDEDGERFIVPIEDIEDGTTTLRAATEAPEAPETAPAAPQTPETPPAAPAAAESAPAAVPRETPDAPAGSAPAESVPPAAVPVVETIPPGDDRAVAGAQPGAAAPEPSPRNEPLFDAEPTEGGFYARVSPPDSGARTFMDEVYDSREAATAAAPDLYANLRRSQEKTQPSPRKESAIPVKRPVTNAIRGLKIQIGSRAAQEFEARGIDTRTHPGMFVREGGLKEIDNLPAVDYPDIRYQVGEDGNGYLSPNGIFDTLTDEMHAVAQGRDPQSLYIAERNQAAENAEQARDRFESDPAPDPEPLDLSAYEGARAFTPQTEGEAVEAAEREMAVNRDIDSALAETRMDKSITPAERAELFRAVNENGGSAEDVLWGIIHRSADRVSTTTTDAEFEALENIPWAPVGREEGGSRPAAGEVQESAGRPEDRTETQSRGPARNEDAAGDAAGPAQEGVAPSADAKPVIGTAKDPLKRKGDWQDADIIATEEDGTETEVSAAVAVKSLMDRLGRARRVLGCLNA